MAEIQELTNRHVWRYVDSANNPAEDVTRGKRLRELVVPNRWSQGPSFLLQSPDSRPEYRSADQAQDASELCKSVFCGVAAIASGQSATDLNHHSSWKELLEVTAQELHGAADFNRHPTADDYRQAERVILQRVQKDSFSQE